MIELADEISAKVPLGRWQGDRGTYHLVTFTGDTATAFSALAAMHRLEFGRSRGFGSLKILARIGDTEWKTSVFPQQKQSAWVLLVSKPVMRAEKISYNDTITVSVKAL